MQRLTKWYPYFSILCNPEKIRGETMALEKFLQDSEHGDCLEINGDYTILGAAEGYKGPKGDGVTGEGDKIEDGDYILTSDVASINRTRHNDPDGYNFTIFTGSGNSYDVSAEGFSKDALVEAREAAERAKK